MAKVRFIESHADAQTSDFWNLKDIMLRSSIEPSSGIYIAESLKVFRRALSAGHKPVSVLTSERWVEKALNLL